MEYPRPPKKTKRDAIDESVRAAQDAAPLRLVVDDPVNVSREEALRILDGPIRESFVSWEEVVGREVIVTNVFAWRDRGRDQWVLDFDFAGRRGRVTWNRETLGKTPGRDDRVRALRTLTADGGVRVEFIEQRQKGRPRRDFVLVRAPSPLASPTPTPPKSTPKSTPNS